MAETLAIKKSKSIVDEISKVEDRIMRRAYEIFSANGSNFGKEIDDWLKAERELVWKPAIELEERDGEFRLQVAIPGVDPKDIDIEITADDVLVKAETHHEHEEKTGEIYACEFASGNVFRSIHLPKPIDLDKVNAEFKNGVLTVKASIAAEAREKKLKVEAA